MEWRTPAGPLIHEHRLIERVVALFGEQAAAIGRGAVPDLDMLRIAVDFVRSYADECHHGKEEALLFKVLAEKNMNAQLAEMMEGLILDHRRGRMMVGELDSGIEDALAGGSQAAKTIQHALAGLAEMYPRHIYTEDQEFFMPAMEYLSDDEQEWMLADFREFDASLIHSHYADVVDALLASESAWATSTNTSQR